MDCGLISCILSVILIILIHKWATKNLDFFKVRGIKHIKPVPVFGNLLNTFLKRNGFMDALQNVYDQFKESKICGFYNLRQPTYIVCDAEVIKQIAIKEFDNFMNHNTTVFDEHMDSTASRAVIALTNEKWRDMRSTLSPSFTSSKMKVMFRLMTETSDDFIEYIQEMPGKKEVNATDIMARYTLNGIATSILGFKSDCLRDGENEEVFILGKAMHKQLMDPLTPKKLFSLICPKLFKLFGMQLLDQKIKNFFKRVIVEEMNVRDQNKTYRADLVQLLLETRKGKLHKTIDQKEDESFSANIEYDVNNVNSKKREQINWTDEEYSAQGAVFFLAGFHTTANFLQMTVYLLAKNQDAQSELIAEIDQVIETLDGRKVSYEVIQKMKYLDMVVSESLRMWPPAVLIDRECSKDCTITTYDGSVFNFTKGDILIFPFKQLHYDERYWENPKKFNPQRFSDENKHKINQGAFIPFGLGPRSCIGSRFALIETKLLIFNILTKFSIEVCGKTPLEAKFKLGLMPSLEKPIYVDFKPRK